MSILISYFNASFPLCFDLFIHTKMAFASTKNKLFYNALQMGYIYMTHSAQSEAIQYNSYLYIHLFMLYLLHVTKSFSMHLIIDVASVRLMAMGSGWQLPFQFNAFRFSMCTSN